ncbi:MAG: phosphoribosylformylglycinamidine synthase subunit PurL [Bacteroidetes bacterium]|nr:phosphoribosylformylglycinamidine synthase subunit PurL [Bacteroidota bacterium]
MKRYLPVLREEPDVTLELALEHGLTEEEYYRMLKFLGRTPTYTELGIYSVMWSEHCSYKNSIAVLKMLPRSGKKLLVSAGEENAGLIDIGDGLAVAFKIESHNHPSAIEPYQGAATGVGGILRDIFSMGARPIAVLNSLRFGELNDARVKYLFKNVVKGIGDYGNSFGVPTVAGEVYFDNCYRTNPLVNAMAVGIVEHSYIAKASAKGEGNTVLIVGSSTGRDGIHGATFASEEISEKSESKRPAVQVGDPFVEKLLLEATLEAIRTGHVVGIQDMGAAGITCSTTEMSARGGMGMEIDLLKVPLRESNMTPYEIMLSESQERMLFIVSKGYEEEIIRIFKKWDIEAEPIGTVVNSKFVTIKVGTTTVAQVPAKSLVLGGDAPVYIREQRRPTYLDQVHSFDITSLPPVDNYNETFLKLLSRPSIASKRWIYEQYDAQVRTNTILYKNCDAAVVRIKGTTKALAMKTDGNGRYVYLNARRGGQIAVAESARNVVCVGAQPVAITNCLNFGNPYDPEVYWQFYEAVQGIAEACTILETPVTGGNVSFYNESNEETIYPTPVIGMLGIIDDIDQVIDSNFKEPGDIIWELGRNFGEIGGSEYLMMITKKAVGDAPNIDLHYERSIQQCLLEMNKHNLLKSAHDISDGGIAVALAESIVSTKGLGLHVEYNCKIRPDFMLFSESQSRIILTTENKPTILQEMYDLANKFNVQLTKIGIVTDRPQFNINATIMVDVEKIKDVYYNAIERIIE